MELAYKLRMSHLSAHFAQEIVRANAVCNKPHLHHLPCSHVVASCAKAGVDSKLFVSEYFKKDVWAATWSGELRGWRAVHEFTRPPVGLANWVPDVDLLVTNKGRRRTHRIKNSMDEATNDGGRRRKQCLLCHGEHMRKDCELYPLVNASDGTQTRVVPMKKTKKKQATTLTTRNE